MLNEPRHRGAFPMWADATDEQWNDWRWQFRNRITTPAQLNAAFRLSDRERDAAARSLEMFRLGITPHYATLIDPDDTSCPIRLQTDAANRRAHTPRLRNAGSAARGFRFTSPRTDSSSSRPGPASRYARMRDLLSLLYASQDRG